MIQVSKIRLFLSIPLEMKSKTISFTRAYFFQIREVCFELIVFVLS
jgi:hypothetical protein